MADPKHRKKINRLKKMILFVVLALILLPTILCIFLFIRMNSLSDELNEIKFSLQNRSDTVVVTENETKTTGERKDKQPPAMPAQTTESINETTLNLSETTKQKETETSAEETQRTVSDKEAQQEEAVKKALAEGRKVVYLTFDDGPSGNTMRLLDLLDQYGIKVTFFVNGKGGFEKEYKEIVARGHSLGTHSFSHKYENVYKSTEEFTKELEQTVNYVKGITGYESKVFRFPGGSSNSYTKISVKEFIKILENKNMHYFDWNVSSKDGGNLISADEIYKNVINGVKNQSVSVVLMHDLDAKYTTYDALPRIIEQLQAWNCLILPITMSTEPVHHNVK